MFLRFDLQATHYDHFSRSSLPLQVLVSVHVTRRCGQLSSRATLPVRQSIASHGWVTLRASSSATRQRRQAVAAHDRTAPGPVSAPIPDRMLPRCLLYQVPLYRRLADLHLLSDHR